MHIKYVSVVLKLIAHHICLIKTDLENVVRRQYLVQCLPNSYSVRNPLALETKQSIVLLSRFSERRTIFFRRNSVG